MRADFIKSTALLNDHFKKYLHLKGMALAQFSSFVNQIKQEK
jgi:hypothetical protein